MVVDSGCRLPASSPKKRARGRSRGRDQESLEKQSPLKVLDGAVSKTPYLLGDSFTVADLNVASVLSWARPARIDLGAVPKMADWFKRCADRPAARAARDLQR